MNNAGNVQNGALPNPTQGQMRKPPMSGAGTSTTKIIGQGQNHFFR
jgi:hypothetical protein